MIGIANDVNIICSGKTDIQETDLKVKIPFGGLMISVAEKKLLDQFSADYDPILKGCINTDFTVQVNFMLYDEIDSMYRENWDTKSLKFRAPEIRNLIFDILSTLSTLTEYLSEEYLKAVPSNHMYLIPHNQSFEAGEKLRKVLRP